MDPDAPFWVLAVGSTLLDAAVAGLALFVVPRWRNGEDESSERPIIDMRRLIVAAAFTTLIFLLRMPPLALGGVGLFGWVYLAYVDAVVLVPTIGAATLAGVATTLRTALATSVKIGALGVLGKLGANCCRD